MKNAVLLLLCITLFTSCVKDDVNVDELITNPLDPDYTGPSYITITNSFVDVTPGNTEDHVIEITVDNSGFPPNTDYDLYIVEGNGGEETTLLATTLGGNNFIYRNASITTGGIEYCYDIHVRVSYSDTRPEIFCATL